MSADAKVTGAPDVSCCFQRCVSAEERPRESVRRDGVEKVGWGWRDGPSAARHLGDSPERPAPLSHLLLVDVRGVDSGPSGCRLDRRSGWRFS